MTVESVRRLVPIDQILSHIPEPVMGILGGSFSPPHVGHVATVDVALRTAGLDGVVVIPAFAHAFGKGLAPFGHRMAMARLAFQPLGARVIVSALERSLPRPSFTINTVRALAEDWPGVQWRLMMGSDVAAEMHLWRDPEALARLASPLVFNRADATHQLEPTDPRVVAQGQQLIPPVSSTEIREALTAADNDQLSAAVPDSVLQFIRLHRLESLISGGGLR